MIHFGFLLCSASLPAAGGLVGHVGHIVGHGAVVAPEAHSGYEFGIDNTACQTLYDTHQETTCNTTTEQACHTEFDTIVDTTHIEECQDIVTEQCHQVSQQVHHSSGVVGHNTQVVPGGVVAGYGHVKREAAGGYGGVQGHTTGPQCHAATERQCHQRPVQNARQVPREVCVPVPRQECHPVPRQVCVPVPRQVCVPVEVRVPRQVCHDYQVEGAHQTHVGHPVAHTGPAVVTPAVVAPAVAVAGPALVGAVGHAGGVGLH